MDTEHIKLIIDLARDAGEGAVAIAIAYIAAPIVQTIIIVGALFAAFATGMRTIRHHNDSERLRRESGERCAEAWMQVARAAGLQADTRPLPHEIQRVIARLNK